MKQFKKISMALTLVAAVGVFAIGPVSAKDWTKIRIGTEGAFPPFNAVDGAGKLVGFDIDIGNALCAKIKAECSWVAQEWDGIIPALVAGKYDVIIASMFITDKRKKKVAFSKPYYKAAMSFAAPKDTKVTDFSPGNLKGKKIGAQNSTTQSDYLTAVHPDATLRFYRTQDEVNLDMVNGRLDLQVSDLVPLLEWTEKTKDGKCCKVVGEPIIDRKYVGDGVGMAVRQEDNDLVAKLNKALDDIVADGTYKKINDKYFSLDLYTLK